MGVSNVLKIILNSKVICMAKEAKWTSLEGSTQPTFLESLISKYDFRPIKLLGLFQEMGISHKCVT